MGSDPAIARTAPSYRLSALLVPQHADVQVPAQPRYFRRELGPFHVDWAVDPDQSGWDRAELPQKMAQHHLKPLRTKKD